MTETMAINPSMTKERARRERANRKDREMRRAAMRADPSHPCHKYPDELIHLHCDKMVEARRQSGKDTVDRDDILCEIICRDSKTMYRSKFPSEFKKYVRFMITVYMNPKYPAEITDRYRKTWRI